MKFVNISILCLLLFNFVFNFQISYAQELDEQCVTFCKENGFSDGHYLAPEPGAKCKDGFNKNPDNEICCCKKAKE